MKNSKLIYLLFIISIILFIAIRIYAPRMSGGLFGANSNTSVSSSTDDSTLAVSDPVDIAAQNYFPDTETSLPTNEDYKGLLNDPWHGDFTPIKEFSGEIPRIVCFGDSLTESIDEQSAYPDYLRELTGCEVINYGVTSENTSMIAMRAGGLGVTLNHTVIPASPELIPIFLQSDNGDPIYFLEYGDGGVNPCYIDGIEGNLSKLNGAYYFKRSEKGERVYIDEGTPFVTYAMNDKNENDILILFTGTNDSANLNNIYQIIELQRDCISYYGTDKFLVIGLTFSNNIDELSDVNEILANEYEDNFLDIRSYLLNYGLADAGITPTSADRNNIAKGQIPSSLTSDYVHGNKHFYSLLASQINRRLQYLGYLP